MKRTSPQVAIQLIDKLLSRSSGHTTERILKGNPNPSLSDEKSDSRQAMKVRPAARVGDSGVEAKQISGKVMASMLCGNHDGQRGGGAKASIS